jgi:uncharacterized protein (DUF2267 family)
MTGLREFDTAASSAEEWVTDLTQRLGWLDRRKVYCALMATLHALRDCLAADEVVYLGGNMPALLRGLYYEGWHPTRRATSAKSRAAFLARIHDGVHRDPGIDSEQVAHAVMGLLAARLPAAELEDVKAATPNALRNLWPS